LWAEAVLDAEDEVLGGRSGWLRERGDVAKEAQWVLKPSLGHGGCEVFVLAGRSEDTLATLRSHVVEWHEAAQWVLQRYVTPLMLLRPVAIRKHLHKFHLRVYALCAGEMRVFVYREGFVLIAPLPFASGGASGDEVHLTNTIAAVRAAQRRNRRFRAETFVRVISELPRVVEPEHRAAVVGVWEGIRRATAAVFASLKGNVGTYTPSGLRSFELYGLDFLLDTDGTPWLLEVNAGPDIAQQTGKYATFQRKMFADLLDVVLPPPAPHAPDYPPRTTPWGLRADLWESVRPGFALGETASRCAHLNGWDLVWDEVWGGGTSGGAKVLG
jgi:hypothetical protein